MTPDAETRPGGSGDDDAALVPTGLRSGETRESPGSEGGLSPGLAVHFPGYQVLRELHRGGQGVVYLAIQRSTRRRVAIKVLKGGHFSSPAELARFEREVKLLAQLRHPNVAVIHDSNLTGPHAYFVMEYISGQPLDVYVGAPLPVPDAARPANGSGARSGSTTRPSHAALAIDDLLRIFCKVCDAVHAAHERGVIHRDLKPRNILVDADGEPHILDFGLAKSLIGESARDDESPLVTLTGQFVGSLPWASPEQVEGRASELDATTDVYSLGVILYQSLTGRFPYPVHGAWRAVIDNILSATPAAPSAARRDIDADLETIILKCLRKEREHRYRSAGQLRDDLQRYLAGRPIEARRDRLARALRHRMRGLIRSHTSLACAALVAISSLAAHVVGVPIAFRWTRLDALYRGAAIRLMPAPGAAALENVRVVAIAPDYHLDPAASSPNDALTQLARRLGLDDFRLDRGDYTAVRRLHARLLRKLVGCGAKALAFDIAFPAPSPHDAELLDAIHALQQSGCPAVLARQTWTESNALADLSLSNPPVVPLGCVRASCPQDAPWSVEAVCEPRASEALPSLALATVAAYRRGQAQVHYEIDAPNNLVEIKYYSLDYRTAAAAPVRHWLNEWDAVLLSHCGPVQDKSIREGEDLRIGDEIGTLAVRMPSDEALRSITVDYLSVFDADTTRLKALFDNRVILVADGRHLPDFRPYDRHGRRIAGYHLHATAISQLISAATIRYPANAEIPPLTLAGALAGLAIGWRYAAHWPKRLAAAVALTLFGLIASLLVFGLHRYLCNPTIPLLAAWLACESVARLRPVRAARVTA